MKDTLVGRQNSEFHLQALKSISVWASDLEDLLKPINESLLSVRKKISDGENTHIPHLQKLIDEQDKQKKFSEEYEKFLQEMKPHDLQCRGLSTALIIVLSGEVKRVTSFATEIFNIHDANRGWGHAKIHIFCPPVNAVPWAEGVWAASNYVRHGDEWHLLPIRKVKNGKPVRMDAIERLNEEGSSNKGMAITNLTVLQKLGISPEMIVFEHRDVSFELVERLRLNHPSEVVDFFRRWGERLFSEASKLIG